VLDESENIIIGSYEDESSRQVDLFSGLTLNPGDIQRLDAAVAAYQVFTNDADTT
jgi:hypothetical protein